MIVLDLTRSTVYACRDCDHPFETPRIPYQGGK